MISLRYHLVTIVAVFLALALGLLAGSSFGQPALVDQLRGRTDVQLARIDELRAEVEAADARTAALDAFAADAYGYLVPGRLIGTRVVVVTQEGLPAALESSVLEALEDAGARILLTVALQPDLVAVEGSAAEARDAALAITAPEDPVAATAAALGERFAAAVAPVAAGDDVLARLVSAGLIAARDGSLDEEVRLQVAGELAVVVLGGSDDAQLPPTSEVASRLLDALLANGARLAACAGSSPEDAVWLDGVTDRSAVTVAAADSPSGATALVLGLRSLLDTGEGGAYGGDGAGLPPLP